MSYENVSARKKAELESLEKDAIQLGVQYVNTYKEIEAFKIAIDSDEKKAAIKFILGDALEQVAIGFQFAPIVAALPAPEEMTEMNYREFKLFQDIIKNIQLKGRDNLVTLAKSMQAFNTDGNRLADTEAASTSFARQYNTVVQQYVALCNKYKVTPVNIDEAVDAAAGITA